MPALPPNRSENGFTFMELLAVILVIGVLAAIAIPTFLSHRNKGFDSDAKSNVRNLVTHVESCFAQERNYRDCDGDDSTGQADDALSLGEIGATWGSAPGEVEVLGGTTQTSYTARAVSKNGGNTFDIEKTVGSGYTHSCDSPGEAGCQSDSTW